MPTIVEDCPRCGAKSMTFDVVSDVWQGTRYNWQDIIEVGAICRRCKGQSVLRISLTEVGAKGRFHETGSVTKLVGDLEPLFRSDGFIDVSEVNAMDAPENLPPDIDAAFREGAKCLAIDCPNAASSMFRLCLDMATRSLLPPVEEPPNGPSNHERRNLAPRLRWLFDHGLLPADLRDLSTAVKENGDEGTHEGKLTEADAADVFDFAVALLERLYTQPARIAAAQERRAARKGPQCTG